VTDVAGLVGDLETEQLELQAVVAAVDADKWLAPTPAWGWDVRDTIAHLADTDEMAIDTARGGPYAINDVAARAASGAARVVMSPDGGWTHRRRSARCSSTCRPTRACRGASGCARRRSSPLG
jgi:hypothetical protein